LLKNLGLHLLAESFVEFCLGEHIGSFPKRRLLLGKFRRRFSGFLNSSFVFVYSCL
jgi:hypothetical protein